MRYYGNFLLYQRLSKIYSYMPFISIKPVQMFIITNRFQQCDLLFIDYDSFFLIYLFNRSHAKHLDFLCFE